MQTADREQIAETIQRRQMPQERPQTSYSAGALHMVHDTRYSAGARTIARERPQMQRRNQSPDIVPDWIPDKYN